MHMPTKYIKYINFTPILVLILLFSKTLLGYLQQVKYEEMNKQPERQYFQMESCGKELEEETRANMMDHFPTIFFN